MFGASRGLDVKKYRWNSRILWVFGGRYRISGIIRPTKLTVRAKVGEGPDDLLHRCQRVGPMSHDNVDIIQAEAAERRVHALEDVLLREARVVGSGPAPEELSRDHYVAALEAEVVKGLAEDLLALTRRVDLGCVEVIDAVVEGLQHALLASLLADLAPDCPNVSWEER